MKKPIIEIANHKENYKVCQDCGKFNLIKRKRCYGCMSTEFKDDVRVELSEFYNSFPEHTKEEIDEIEVEV